MCGRYTRKEQIEALLEVLKAVIQCDLTPRVQYRPEPDGGLCPECNGE